MSAHRLLQVQLQSWSNRTPPPAESEWLADPAHHIICIRRLWIWPWRTRTFWPQSVAELLYLKQLFKALRTMFILPVILDHPMERRLCSRIAHDNNRKFTSFPQHIRPFAIFLINKWQTRPVPTVSNAALFSLLFFTSFFSTFFYVSFPIGKPPFVPATANNNFGQEEWIETELDNCPTKKRKI